MSESEDFVIRNLKGPDCAETHISALEAQVSALREENNRFRRAIGAVNELICHSSGVIGLHLNGNVAYWGELKRGGRYEGWLSDLSDANDAPAVTTKQPPFDDSLPFMGE